MAIKLNTGKVGFEIQFTDANEKEMIYFNPSDPDLFTRLKAFEKRVTEQVDAIKGLDANEENPADDTVVSAYNDVVDIVKKELDIAFDGNISSVIFKHCSPFATIDGKYFFEQFIEGIKPEILKHTKKEAEAAQKRMQKYKGRYSK